MKIAPNSVSFKGKYLLVGDEKDQKEVIKELKSEERIKSYCTFKITNEKTNETVHLILTNEDRDAFVKKTGKENAHYTLKNTRNNLLESCRAFLAKYIKRPQTTTIIDAETILTSDKKEEPLILSDGKIIGENLLLDGAKEIITQQKNNDNSYFFFSTDGYREYINENDKREVENIFQEDYLNTVVFANGESKTYYDNGVLYFDNSRGEIKRKYYKNGALKYEIFSNGLHKSYYENGVLGFENFIDGTKKGYHSNGKLEYEKFPDGYQRQYYRSGTLRCEKFPDKSQKAYYQNGALKYEVDSTGKGREYFQDGTLRFEISIIEDKKIIHKKY